MERTEERDGEGDGVKNTGWNRDEVTKRVITKTDFIVGVTCKDGSFI